MKSGYRRRVTICDARRHKPRDAPQSMEGGRLHGRCELCGEIHRSPDMRYRCPGCALVVCVAHAQELEYVCPDCGDRMEISPEVSDG